MLRNRSKTSLRKNYRNARKRNSENADQSSELSTSSDSDSSQFDSDSANLLDETSDSSSFEEECTSPVVGRKLKTRRKRMNSKSKCNNTENDTRNRNSRSTNVVNNRKSHRRSDSHTAGPSRINNSRRSRSETSNARTAKRKYKDRKDDSRTSDSGPCNTSSEDIDDILFPMKKKRVRRVFSNSSESDESVILSTRRRSILDSESSSGGSEIRISGQKRNRNQPTFPSWSDSTTDHMEENSLRESSSSPVIVLPRGSLRVGSTSPIIGVSRRQDLMNYINSSDSSSSSSSMSTGLLSTDSDMVNTTSEFSQMQDSEASSYNTAQSSNNNNKDQISDSDSSDSDGEKCAICLKKFRTQLIGNPSNCEHNFCAPCLKKWSESSTTCPVDRSTFDSIVIRSEINGQIVDRVKVENRNFGIFPPLDIDEVLLNDAINCEICGSGEDEETLLLCDFCNLGYHMACLIPPLSAIPAGSWYCPPCMELHTNPNDNMNEAIRLFSDFPMRPLMLLPPSRRTNRIRTRTAARSRQQGPLPRGRGPTTRGVRSQNPTSYDFHREISNVIESFVASFNAITPAGNRRKKKRRRNRARNNANLGLRVTAPGTAEATVDGKERIVRKVNQRVSTPANPRSITRPSASGPSEIVDMVFPSFSLFGSDELDYFSDEQGELDVDGEVAIMARVRSEYSARRIHNNKRIASSLMNNYDRVNPTMEETGASSSAVNLLDSILESQTLWHSKNVEIMSKKDGKLEIKLKNEENKKPDLTNSTHSSKEIPLFPNKSDGSSENKSYTNNSRYSSLGGSSGGGSNSFTPSTSSFNSLNPSTRPGFSNILGNSSPALDLSPFRGAAPIRFRMNPPRAVTRRQNYTNSQRQSSNSLMNSVQSPKKSSTVSNADDDVDLYDDIDTENAESEKSQEIFALQPPPEPPALLIGSDSSSDDESNGLVIDDKAIKSNIYDPTEPNEDSDSESNQDKNSNMIPGYLRSPSYGGLSEFGPHLPLPEPPALPMELDSVKDSDEEEEAECPNMMLYSSTSMNLANNVQDIPIPDAAYPQDELDCIPIPTVSLSDAHLSESETKEVKTNSQLYSPTDKHDSESSSIGDIQEVPVEERSRLPSKNRNDDYDIRSISSRDSSNERVSSVRSSSVESDRSEHYRRKKRRSRRDSKDKRNDDDKSNKETEIIIDLDRTQSEKPTKEIDLTEADSNDEKEDKIPDNESIDDDVKQDEIIEKDDTESVATVEEIKDKEKSDDESDKDADEQNVPAASAKSDDDKTDTEEDKLEAAKQSVASIEKEKSDKEDSIADTSADVDPTADTIPDNDSAKANSVDVNVSSNYLLPSEDLDPVSDVEYNDFPDYQRSSSVRDRRKKRKKTRRRDSSTDKNESKELEEGEIEEEKSKRKYASQKKKARSETPERSPDRKQKKRRDRKEKNTGKENKESDLQWKKLSKNTKERNYRDGKGKPVDKSTDRNKERELKSKKEKRKEMERYDVRKIVSDKPRPVRDEFGRDISMNRSHSRTRSRSLSYRGRRNSKSSVRRSLSQDDRWIDWSPIWNQRRSRSKTRRSRSRSRNRSRLSGDRYINRSKNREYDKRESRKRRRSVSSEIDKYSPPPAELKKRRRSRDRSRKSESYAPIRSSGRDLPEYYYDRSWSRTISYASLTPEPEQYVRYSRSPSIIEPSARMPLVTSDQEHSVMTSNPQNLTVIVPNVDLGKKKHKKKKETKKKKKKQPSKEVFTSGDNIVVSVNFDDNQKIISAKSSKRKHDEEKVRKKKKDESRKKRKQTLQVSEEVLNAKPVAVIDLNTSPCKEMSPTEVISLTDSGDEANTNENAMPADRRISENQDANKSPERRAYVMTQSGPKTPPEPPIKFTVNSTAPMRPLPTNPIFEQDEIDHEEDSVHYNKGPNTPPEPSNQQCRMTPNATMYDPFEPTKSRSQSPENAEIYEERKDTAASEERRPVIDMFSEDNDKPNESQNAEKSKPQEDAKENTTPKATPTEETQSNASFTKTSPAKESTAAESTTETNQTNGGNTLVLDLSSLGDDFVPKSSIPLVKTSQGKYEFQSGKAPDKPITVVISQQSQPAKPQPQQVMVTPTRQVPTKPVEPMKQPNFPDLITWKLPPPISQPNFSTPPPNITSLPPGTLVTPSKSAPGLLTQNGSQEDSSFEIDDSPYSPASSEGDELFEPPPLNASISSPNKHRPSPMPAVNSYKSRVDALFTSSPNKKMPPRGNVPPMSKPVSAIKGTKKIMKPPMSNKKEVVTKADEEQLKILDDVPNSAVEMIVKEKFLKKLHRQERVVEEVKVVLKPHYAKKHITKEEYKDILRRAVPKICHNKSGDINPSKIQGLVEAYVKKIRHSKKKPTMGAGAPLFPPVKTGKPMKQQKSLWG